ncbi:hypothetical protein KPL38_11385 [Clostridium psychrophilum]|nr:hypothetical protein [Clostridium psychrophilum]
MYIVGCLKQVPDPNEVKFNFKTETLIRSRVPLIINPTDKNVLEAVLVLKDKYSAYVIVISMGTLQAERSLREAFSMGADKSSTWNFRFVNKGI